MLMKYDLYLNGFNDPKMKAFLVSFVVCCIIQLYQIKFGHGTTFPIVALLTSSPYNAYYSVDPPVNWNRNTKKLPRVVVSLTTMPENMMHLKETIDSLLYQTFLPDAIYISIPEINRRTGTAYPPFPPWLSEEMYSVVKPTKLPQDYGPLSKLMGALLVEKNPDTIVITVDDDKIYSPNLVQKLVWNSINNKNAAFGPCGWTHVPALPPEKIIPGYFLWSIRGSGRLVDTLQACCGNVYRVGFFPDISLLAIPPWQCYTADDLWISFYLHKRNISRVLLGGSKAGLDPATPKWKYNQTNGHPLSEFNSKAGKDANCIEAAKKRLNV